MRDRKAYRAAYYAKHREREREKRRARMAADPERYRDAQRLRYYGVSAERAKALLAAQGQRCAVCRTDKPSGRGFWHLDHDHATGARVSLPRLQQRPRLLPRLASAADGGRELPAIARKKRLNGGVVDLQVGGCLADKGNSPA